MPPPRPPRATPQQGLDVLRRHRVPGERDLGLADTLGFIGRGLKADARRSGGLGAAWSTQLPAALIDRTEILSVARGVLRVRCDDSATLHEVSAWLRAGGHDRLVRAAPVALSKVKLEL